MSAATQPSRPCGRGGCTGALGPRGKLFCSLRCVYLHRARLGFGHTLSAEQRLRGSRKGARVSGDRGHRRALLKYASDIAKLIPRDIMATLDDKTLRLIKAVTARGIRLGYRRGYSSCLGAVKRKGRVAA